MSALFRRLIAAFLLALAGVAGVSLATAAPAVAAPVAAPSYQLLVPDAGMWCADWAASQLGNAVDIKYYYVGMTGRSDQNTLKCKIIVSVAIQEGGSGKRLGWSGVLPYPGVSYDQSSRPSY